jgi:hypothetical protein
MVNGAGRRYSAAGILRERSLISENLGLGHFSK